MKNNIQDATNLPKDWEDFWNGDEETILQELMQLDPNKVDNSPYVRDVLDGDGIICKRESPLSD